MSVFVLVHGSFHGGWCWQKVTPLLREAGHEVHTPTMTGLGERSHLVSPQAGLRLNVQDIVNVIEYEDLEDVVLVGHSYGSLVVTGVAEHVADRIEHLVHLDGYLPEDGQSAWDITPTVQEQWEAEARASGTEWLVPPADPADAYEISDPGDLEWLREKMVATPLSTHEEAIDLPEERAKDLPRSYIACTQYESFQHMAEKARNGDMTYYELDTGHDAMVSEPVEFADILLEVASSG